MLLISTCENHTGFIALNIYYDAGHILRGTQCAKFTGADLPEVCDKTSVEKSKLLPQLFQQIAIDENCDFLDASLIVHASQIDGLHLDEQEHVTIAQAISTKIKQMV